MTRLFVMLFVAMNLTFQPAQAGLFNRDWVDDEIQKIIDAVNNAKNSAREMRDNMRDGASSFSFEMRDAIDDAADDIQRSLAERREGREEFVSTECMPFRADLLGLIQSVEDLTNTIYFINDVDIKFDMKRLKKLPDVLPCRALYPLYRVLAVESNIFESVIVERLAQASDDLLALDATISESATISAAFSSTQIGIEFKLPNSNCSSILNDDSFEQNLLRVNKAALGLKMLGKLLIAAGQTSLIKKVSIWGWVGIGLKNNRKKRFGGVMDGTADAMFVITNYFTNKFRYCVLLQGQEAILEAIRNNRPPWGRFN